MPIPVRTPVRSPSKADKAREGQSLQQTSRGQTRSLTRLTNNVSKAPSQLKTDVDSATTITSSATRQAREIRPGISRSVPVATPAAGHGRSLSAVSARNASAKDDTSDRSRASSQKADTTAPGKSVHGRNVSVATTRPGTTHSRTISASTSADTGTRNLHGAIPKRSGLTDKPTLKKPDFNNYKQHYSPKKTTQVSAAASAPVRLGGGGASVGETSTETRRLQDELLQLAVLYEKSQSTLQSYESSIKTRLAACSDGLKQQIQSLESVERGQLTKVNADAAKTWTEAGSAVSAGSNRSLILAHSVRVLNEITARGGPLDIVMSQFDEWQVSAVSKTSNRANRDARDSTAPGLLAPLDPQWSALVDSVQNRVRTCSESLADLQGPSDSSSIGLLLKMLSRLAEEILREIAICRDVEAFILQREQEWMEAAISRALFEAGSHSPGQLGQLGQSGHHHVRKGIWDTHGT
ncbi:hypothetical protein A1O1_06821 [Capronia coronata CBS 617.96]|uniref:Uncharacterized protein n=1 Tax=Capronia coronata CBS 617.96 TaxID=1182541 RepID=W9XRK6_9EURO|nr:uncharacterized protein A1O1_06821 [Capronia coronata CBS 617.96]EXJ83202.1 hypothetical protein A1O1_06821 [Capronia coronata CBS 617.96]